MVDRIVVIGPREVQQHALSAGANAALNPVGGGAENMLAGLEWLTADVQSPLPVAIMACDLPFVDAQALGSLLQNLPSGADVVVPLVKRDDFLIRFPGAPAAFVRLMEGSFALT
jgi:CTP:molybdopterin cytidylyltransferase MocA